MTDLLADKVGQPYTANEMKQVNSDAKRRFEAKQPPGYADKKKDDDRAIGDYVLWRQLLDEACKRKVPVLLITDDQKEDWYRREHGATIGPLAELGEEMLAGAGVQFYALTLARFVQTAPAGLRSPVKDTTVSEVNRLGEERRRQGLEADRLREALARERNSLRLARPEGPPGPASELLRLEKLQNNLVSEITEIRARLMAAVEAADNPASGVDDDPRSYVSALRAQLASDQERLGAVTEQLQRLRLALSADE